MTMMKPHARKSISDLSLAAFLSSIGHQIIEFIPGKKVIFAFQDSPELTKDILAFYNKTARVDPLTFSDTLRNLKGLIRQSEHN